MRTVRYTLDQAIEKLAPENKPARDDLDSLKNEAQESWDLGLGYPKSFQHARFGWVERASDLLRYSVAVSELHDASVSSRWDFSGDMVDVGRLLSGEPECMLQFYNRDPKLITLEVNISARAKVDATHLFNRGVAVAGAIMALQSQGFSVRLAVYDAVSETNSGLATHKTVVQISDYGEYMDPGRIAFFVAHPAALRRAIFRLNEHEPLAVRQQFGFYSSGGYGYPGNPPAETPASEGDIVVDIPWVEGERLRTPRSAFQVVAEKLQEYGVSLTSAGE